MQAFSVTVLWICHGRASGQDDTSLFWEKFVGLAAMMWSITDDQISGFFLLAVLDYQISNKYYLITLKIIGLKETMIRMEIFIGSCFNGYFKLKGHCHIMEHKLWMLHTNSQKRTEEKDNYYLLWTFN